MATKKRFAWENMSLITGEVQPGWQDTPVNARTEALVALWDGHLKARILSAVSAEAAMGRTEICEVQVPNWALEVLTILRRPEPVTILGAPVVANENGEYVVRARAEQEPLHALTPP
jgi:hypothetical protein